MKTIKPVDPINSLIQKCQMRSLLYTCMYIFSMVIQYLLYPPSLAQQLLEMVKVYVHDAAVSWKREEKASSLGGQSIWLLDCREHRKRWLVPSLSESWLLPDYSGKSIPLPSHTIPSFLLHDKPKNASSFIPHVHCGWETGKDWSLLTDLVMTESLKLHCQIKIY